MSAATTPRWVPVVVLTPLVALASAVALHSPPRTTAPGTVTSVAPGAVCLDVAGRPLCADQRHVGHLGLGGLRPGDCVAATWQGAGATVAGLTRVEAVAC